MTLTDRRLERSCAMCRGRGVVADYVGLEMKPIAVECEACGGTGELRTAIVRALTQKHTTERE